MQGVRATEEEMSQDQDSEKENLYYAETVGAWFSTRLEHDRSLMTLSAGAGTAMVVWFGGFVVIGGALFQMWQTRVGTGSFEGAFIYGATSALVLLFVYSPDA